MFRFTSLCVLVLTMAAEDKTLRRSKRDAVVAKMNEMAEASWRETGWPKASRPPAGQPEAGASTTPPKILF